MMYPHFREVWAVDQEANMVEVGRRNAAACGAGNVLWRIGRAEDLVAPPGAFELVTIGNAFHRLHRRLVGQKAMDWLAPGCCLAVMGSSSLWTGKEEWQSIARDVIRKWTSGAPVAERRKSDQPRESFEEALQFCGFEEIGRFERSVPYLWSLDTFVGYLYSLSGVSKRILGKAAEPFEAEMRKTLLAYNEQGQYQEVIRFFVILSRRPTATP